jgi:CubicO group peptidase (beta-lactamase class C family)
MDNRKKLRTKYRSCFILYAFITALILSGCGTGIKTYIGETYENDSNYVNRETSIALSDDQTISAGVSDNENTMIFLSEDKVIVDDTERVSPAEAGIREESLELIEDIIETDIDHGFTSAQLAVMRDGKLVYENAWGKLNTYHQDGSEDTESDPVTTDTLYDLASVSKMFGVNYAIQKLETDGKLDLDDTVESYLGTRFSEDVIEIHYTEGENADLETQREWKSNITLRDLLRHQGGFPADPRYCNPHLNTEAQKYDPDGTNLLYAGNDADEKTKEATIEAICRTPLLYKPGTQTLYSDVDYMILGEVVEQVTGEDLDTCLKETFCKPMGLTHITYNPLENGFSKEDCAATELNGNTRDGYVSFDGIRTYTLQGEVHDEKAYYSMGGVSGHAGLFANAREVAELANIMLTGYCGEEMVFSQEVIDEFTAPQSDKYSNWGLGWWRQGNMQRAKYFGTKACADTIGHQGWTGTLVMIDPEKKLVIAFLTNKINSPVTDIKKDANRFDGNWYTTASLGFVPEILYTGLDGSDDVTDKLERVLDKLIEDSESAVKPGMGEDHPAMRNLRSKEEVKERFEISH